MTLAEKQIELDTILSGLNDDEREVVVTVSLRSARRMAKGRSEYGPLTINTDKRDWLEEAREEGDDLPNYFALNEIARDRAVAARRSRR